MTADRPVDGPPAAPARRAHSGAEPAAGVTEPLLEQPFDGDSLYALRATLEAHASRAGLPDGRVMDLVMTVHELATNAVIHGAGSGRVRIWRVDGVLRCEVSDAGPPGAAAGARAGNGTEPDADGSADIGAGGGTGGGVRWPVRHGHGLWIARYLTDGFTLVTGPGESVATVDFTLPAAADGSPFGLVRHEHGSHVLLELTGTLSEQAAEEITAVVGDVASAGRPRLVLDLSGVTFWDAVGVAALITAQRQVEAASGMVVLAGPAAGFRERLDALSPTPFTVYADHDDAARRFRSEPGS
ncbi:ATP-binding protein [Nonomuraea sp. NPDC047897]|uniref:ATP-binding protein n=1 Tax=Nonomuraea sp. NPDC047897 TaxID=3364346 RepID=UPI003716770F